MKAVFADTHYWVAQLSKHDPDHAKAKAVARSLPHGVRFITTDMVLTEFLNSFSSRGSYLKQAAAQLAGKLRTRADTTIIPQTREQFENAFAVYVEYKDKSWGLTDCASYLTMKEHNVSEALTYDKHFQQMGFKALLRERHEF